MLAALQKVIDLKNCYTAHQGGILVRSFAPLVTLFAGVGVFAPLASAHFKLLEPPSWIQENNLGDPQKLGPCGGTSANAGEQTKVVTKVQGGQKLHLKWTETVYHPGHYRISL